MWSGPLLQVEWSACCQVLATQLPRDSRGGDDAIGNAMMIGWVGGSCHAHAVSLHALTAKHNKTATMVTSQGNSKVAFSNWKHYFSLIEIKGKNVYITCTLCLGKKTLCTSASSNSNLKQLTSAHSNMTHVAAAAANPTPSPNAASEGDGDTLFFSGQQQVNSV